ncbi:MAG: ABC transporter permease [Dehalococcoidia bacterium]
MLSLYQYRDLLLIHVLSDIKSRYKQSLLGPAWAILFPLVLMLIFVVVRSIVGIDSDGIPYPIFAYSALLPWTLFANSITFATPKIVQSRSLIRKVYFPREILPVAGVMTALVDFLLAFIILAGLMAYYHIAPTLAVLWVPVLLVIQLFLAVGVGLVTSALGGFRRDIVVAIPLLIQFWMLLCPVVYPLSSVPAEYQSYYLMNPMAGLIETWRTVLIVGEAPEMRLMASAVIGTLLVCALGYWFFKRVEMKFADIV